MPEIVPASTRVHVTRIRNVGTERLYRRAAWLAENKHRLAREVDGPDNPGGRNRLAVIAREIYAIDAELVRRDHTHNEGEHRKCDMTGASSTK